LREKWVEKPETLATRLQLDQSVVLGALAAFTQTGRVIYDINQSAYRIRELSREALPMEELRFANPREDAATRFVLTKNIVNRSATVTPEGMTKLNGTVRDKDHSFQAELIIDKDERALKGKCTCNFYQQNKMMQGPCEHMLALRIAQREMK
jgi:mannosyltransferase OCH1-like enzyme